MEVNKKESEERKQEQSQAILQHPLQYADEGQGVKEILLSGSAGALTFQMGYLYALTEFVGKEKLREYIIGGVSAGTAIGVYFHTTLHSDYDLKYFYLNKIRKFFEKENRRYYGFFTSGQLMQKFCLEHWDLMEELKVPHVNGKFHAYITEVNGFFDIKKKLIDHFEDKYDFTEALTTSGMVPFLTKPQIFNTYKGKWGIDGGLTAVIPYKHKESYKIFINALPKYTRQWPVIREEIKNIHYLDITENTDVSFPRDYWIWDDTFSDEMFVKGQIAAQNDKENILKIFK